MRRFSILLLLLALLLVGCSARFTTTEGGYLDEKTGKIYKPLSEAFEAISGGEVVGEWESTLYEDTLTFLEIPDADPNRFLADERGNIYCSDEVRPDASGWHMDRIYVCDVGSLSMAAGGITDAAVIDEIRTLWHEGEEAELPYEDMVVSRRLKMTGPDCPGIYYCVLYYIYEDGTAYFYDRLENRAVLVGEDLMKKIPIN